MKKFLMGLIFIVAAISQSAQADGRVAHDYRQLKSGDAISGGVLYPYDSLVSNNNIYRLTQQADGNLVLYKNGVAKWATYQNGTHSVIQADGNFVQYQGTTPVWASYTGTPRFTNNYTLFLTDDGSLQVQVYGPYVPDPVAYRAIIIPADPTPGGGDNPPCQMRPFPVCVFPGTPSQYNSSVSACSQYDAATYASRHGWDYGACH